MHDEILGAIGFAVPLLLLAWYANRIRHPERSWLSAFLIFLGGSCRFSWRRFGSWASLVSHGRRCDPGVRYGEPFPLGGLLALAQIPTASTSAAEAAAAK